MPDFQNFQAFKKSLTQLRERLINENNKYFLKVYIIDSIQRRHIPNSSKKIKHYHLYNKTKLINELIAARILKELYKYTPETKIISGKIENDDDNHFFFASKKIEGNNVSQPSLEEIIEKAKNDPNVAYQLGFLIAICDYLYDIDTIGPEHNTNIFFQEENGITRVIKIDPGEADVFRSTSESEDKRETSNNLQSVQNDENAFIPSVADPRLKHACGSAKSTIKLHEQLKLNPHYQRGLGDGYLKIKSFDEIQMNAIIDKVKKEAKELELYCHDEKNDQQSYERTKKILKERQKCLAKNIFKISVENLEERFKEIIANNPNKNETKKSCFFQGNQNTSFLSKQQLKEIKELKKMYYKNLKKNINSGDNISKETINNSALLNFNRTRYQLFVKEKTRTKKKAIKLLTPSKNYQ